MESNSSRSSRFINRVFHQFGLVIVQDRSSCSLARCRTSVCRPPAVAVQGTARRARKRRHLEEAVDSMRCSVCQDQTSGSHYGVPVCDMCKEFFEQSVRQRLIYDCHHRRACDLTLQRRNHCQGCRWDRCLEAGMLPSAVSKSPTFRSASASTNTSVSDVVQHQPQLQLLRLASIAAQSSLSTPQPSLPSPTTDTASSSHGDSSEEDEAQPLEQLSIDRRLARELLAVTSNKSPKLLLPISGDLVRSALTPLAGPERLRDRLENLERSCLTDLFRWNKRRLSASPGEDFGGFGPAAANWSAILLASAVRQYLATSAAVLAPGGDTESSLAADLADRLSWLVGGRLTEFQHLLGHELDHLVALVSDLCGQVFNTVIELQRDALADAIWLMADRTVEEISSCQHRGSGQSPAVRGVALSVIAAAEKLVSARPEQRALLLASLVAKDASAGGSGGRQQAPPTDGCCSRPEDSASDILMLKSFTEDSARVPVLFGL